MNQFEDGNPNRGVLSGLVIADFSRVLAGPLASMFLADLGATVIKVERPGAGDDTRAWGPPYVGAMSTYYASVNRNKRSLTLDLSSPQDLALARALVRRSDVLIENFLPGKLASFGLGPEALLEQCRHLVYCSISGFGSAGGAGMPGYDFVVQAVGGLMSITGQLDGEPTKVGVALVDVITGLHATIAILAALRARDRDGQGQHVQVNLLSSLLASLVNQGTAFLNGGEIPKAMGNQHPSIAPYQTLATADGLIAIAVGNDGQFRVLCNEIGRPELADDPRYASNRSRVNNRDSLVHTLEQVLVSDVRASWTQRLQAVGLPCGPVQDIAEAIDLATRLGLEPVVRLGGGISNLANPVTLSTHPVRYHRAPPTLGADSDEVRAWLLAGAEEGLSL